jgi:hypothetical protein
MVYDKAVVHCLEAIDDPYAISKAPEKFQIDDRRSGPRRRNLVIMGAGETSLHHQWVRDIPDSERNWDLCLSFYGKPENYPPPGPYEYASRQPGVRKWIAIHAAMYEGSPFWDYERIFVIDDDILTSWSVINRFLDICEAFDLQLAQPSLKPDCFVTHALTAQRPGSLIRFTTFVEAMAPCFTSAALRQCIAVTQGGYYGFGIDHLWPLILGAPYEKIAIVDAVAIDHTRHVATSYPIELAVAEEIDLFARYGNPARLGYQELTYIPLPGGFGGTSWKLSIAEIAAARGLPRLPVSAPPPAPSDEQPGGIRQEPGTSPVTHQPHRPKHDAESYFLLTYHGHLLCRNLSNGSLAAYDARQIPPNAAPLRLSRHLVCAQTFTEFLTGAQPARVALAAGARPLAGIMPAGHGGCVAFASERGFASAQPDGTIEYDRAAPDLWESFLPLSAGDMSALNHVLDHSWIIMSSGALVPREKIRIGERFGLWFDDLAFDLSYNLPLTGIDQAEPENLPPSSIKLLRDGWRIDEARLYRPMVFSAAFGDPDVIGQLILCLNSLIEFGRYDGDVHLITDQPAADVLASVPGLDPARLTIQHLEPTDFTGYVASKYLILEHGPAWRAQPLLFVDPDIVFDAPLRPILSKIACLDRIAAPLEDWAPLASEIAVGASLVQRDLGDPRLAHGFNAGTLGIPNLVAHGGVLERIRRIIVNHVALNGRTALAWVDQEIANYVAYRTGLFDTHTISRHVRWGTNTTGQDAGPRSGIVHFWKPKFPAAKRAAMNAYVEALAKMDGRLET